MNNKPLISIVVPVYNSEKYIGDCIESLITQTYCNIEIVVIIDGSTDNSLKICNTFHDRRLHIFKKENAGVSEARNFGIEHATGKYITFVDSDDVCNKYLIENHVRNLQKYNATISCCYYTKNIDDLADDFNYLSYHSVLYNRKEFIKEIIVNKNISNFLWNKMFLKDYLDNIRFPSGVIYEDVLTTYKIALKSNRIIVSDFVGYYYRQHKISLTKEVNVENLNQLIENLYKRNKEILSLYPDLSSYCNKELLEAMIDNYIAISKYKNNSDILNDYRLYILRNNSYKQLQKKYKIYFFLIKYFPGVFCKLENIIFNIKISDQKS